MKNLLFTISIMLFGFATAHGQTIIALSIDQPDELAANAGNDSEIISGESFTLGENPTATGGKEPYSYSWSVQGNIVSTEANPSVNPTENTSYTLVVTDNSGCIATNDITVSINITRINDFTGDELKIYPNPATDMFTIDYRGKNSTISLIDENGKVIWTKPHKGKTNFSAPRVPGVYLLRISDGDKEYVRRILVSK